LRHAGDIRFDFHIFAENVVDQPVRQHLIDLMHMKSFRGGAKAGCDLGDPAGELAVGAAVCLESRIIAEFHQLFFATEVRLRIQQQLAERVGYRPGVVPGELQKTNTIEKLEQPLMIIVDHRHVERQSVSPAEQCHHCFSHYPERRLSSHASAQL
jgi:hypothetical protein